MEYTFSDLFQMLNGIDAKLCELIDSRPKEIGINKTKVSRKEAAHILCVSLPQIDKMAASGKLTRYRIGSKTVFDIEQVNSMFKKVA